MTLSEKMDLAGGGIHAVEWKRTASFRLPPHVGVLSRNSFNYYGNRDIQEKKNNAGTATVEGLIEEFLSLKNQTTLSDTIAKSS